MFPYITLLGSVMVINALLRSFLPFFFSYILIYKTHLYILIYRTSSFFNFPSITIPLSFILLIHGNPFSSSQNLQKASITMLQNGYTMFLLIPYKYIYNIRKFPLSPIHNMKFIDK